MSKTIFSLFLSGIFFGSGPCLATCGPLLISYIAGTKKRILKGFIAYVLFSFARISIYLFLGMAIFFLGNFTVERFLGNYSKYILIAASSFIIPIGLLMALGKRLELEFCKILEKNVLGHDKKTTVALGLIIGLLPCAPLLAILSYVGLVSKSWIQSLLYSLSFGIGTFVSPLIFLVILASLLPKFLIEKKGIYIQIFNFICGLIIIFFGLQLIKRTF